MLRTNPYRPGAGYMPPYLAGREDLLSDMEHSFESLSAMVPERSIVFTGLRGVGKTVLLNKMAEMAKKKAIACFQIEVDVGQDFTKQLMSFSQKYIRETQIMEKAKGLFDELLDALKSFVLSYNPEDKTFSVSVQDRQLYALIDKEQSMIDLFEKLGEAAIKAKRPICIFIDEMQYMDETQMSHLITSIHRCNQMSYPIMLCGAGLPKLYKMLSKVKSYAERLFLYKDVGFLTEEEARKAICIPAENIGYHFSEPAISKILDATDGYPFFVQQYCSEIFNLEFSGCEITGELAEQAFVKYNDSLAAGFFRSRYEKCSNNELQFVFAMVACGDLPCTIANVAKNMHRAVTSISALRAQLINKGIIYATNFGEIDFTIPHFDTYIESLGEYRQFYSLMDRA